MKKENEFIKITVQEAVNRFAAHIHHEIVDMGGMNWRDAVVRMHWDSMNSCDGFNAFYNHGCRSLIHLSQRQDQTYHICEEQTQAIEKDLAHFGKWYFDDLKEEQRMGCKNIEEYIDKALESANKNDATASDVKALNDYDDSLDGFLNEQRTTVIIDTRFYAKDNIYNKSGKDVVLVQVHINPDDQIAFISATGKDAYIGLFDAEEFMNSIQYTQDSFINSMALKIDDCLSGEAFIDPTSDLID
jgi:hypothetical protein